MNTVMTPEAVRRSYTEGKLKDLAGPNFTGDEVFLFIYPSNDPINEVNGDGELWEIHDWSKDFSKVWTSRREHKTTPETVVWWR
jgi:hypothetical protein